MSKPRQEGIDLARSLRIIVGALQVREESRKEEGKPAEAGGNQGSAERLPDQLGYTPELATALLVDLIEPSTGGLLLSALRCGGLRGEKPPQRWRFCA